MAMMATIAISGSGCPGNYIKIDIVICVLRRVLSSIFYRAAGSILFSRDRNIAIFRAEILYLIGNLHI
jgi:hypothetical protein